MKGRFFNVKKSTSVSSSASELTGAKTALRQIVVIKWSYSVIYQTRTDKFKRLAALYFRHMEGFHLLGYFCYWLLKKRLRKITLT